MAIARLVIVASVAAALAAALVAADPGTELRLAARSGDLDAVKRLVAAGVPVDAADDWGTTALALAAKQGQVDVVAYLLEKGADPSARESFFGSSVLDTALWKGAPDYRIATMLLAAGAEDRAAALVVALEEGHEALARAATSSGPLTESEAAELRARFAGVDGVLLRILGGLETRPDPPPPSYSAGELAAFAGTFGEEGDVRVRVADGRLVLEHGGKAAVLAARAGRVFRGVEDDVTVRYFGRAGTVEGLTLSRGGGEPVRMGFHEAPVVTPESSDLPQIEPHAGPVTVNWPGFRGANRAGVAPGAAPPVDLDLASGEGVAWVAELPGLGNSSPVVWGDRVYVTTAVAEGGSAPLRVGRTGAGDEVEGEEREHRWLVLAFDRSTGAELWRTEIGRAVPLTRRHFKSTQANSTPVTDGEHVVVVFPTAGLACLGTDGSVHWKRELGGLNAGGFNDPGMQWGFASSPIIHDGTVVLQVDIHDGPYVAAFALDDGRPLWRTPRPGIAPSWSTPAVWNGPDGPELVLNGSSIRGYDAASGRELWRLGPTSIQVVASPVVGGGTLYVSSGYPPARPIYAVRPGIRGEHAIESDADAGALAWYRERGGAYMPTPLLYRGLLYVVAHNGRVEAYDARTGDTVARVRLSRGGTCTGSPVAASGRIYQGTEEGTLYVLAADGTLRELAVHELEEPLMATPAISGGLLLVRTPTRLLALGSAAPPGEETAP